MLDVIITQGWWTQFLVLQWYSGSMSKIESCWIQKKIRLDNSTFWFDRSLQDCKGSKAISMMCGKSSPSELILKVINSNNSLRFLKEFEKGDNFYFCQNIILFHFFTFILIIKGKTQPSINLFILITLKFAIFTH